MKVFNMMEKMQELNLAEKGVSFTQEKFTELYDEYNEVMNRSGVNGMIIGAAGVGAAWVTTSLTKKIAKDRLLKRAVEIQEAEEE